MPPAVVFQNHFKDHCSSYTHPERPERLDAVRAGLDRAGITDDLIIENRPVEIAALERVHDPEYVRHTLDEIENQWGNLDGDTFFSPGTRAAALDAAGGTTALARMVQRGEADWGFAALRPPGHHATARRACGFCIFNNVAVAAADLLAETDAKRVAVFDWDVHHGNGTQDIFYDRSDVLYVSIHQWPHFPGSGRIGETGRGAAVGTTVNLPFPAGATDADYRAAMTGVVIPAIERFRPDHILVSAGYDAHRDDFLGGMRLSSRMFGEMAARLKHLADGICGGRITLILEGGYHLEALADSVHETIRGLIDPRIPKFPDESPGAGVRRILDAVRQEISLSGNRFPE